MQYPHHGQTSYDWNLGVPCIILTSRGDRREAIYRADDDREAWLEILINVCGRFHWVMNAYCQMATHYQVLVETIDGNLSRGMRKLNGRYTQS